MLAVAHNGSAANGQPQLLPTRTELDIEGNERAVSDARERVVMRYDYDLLGNRIHQASMEAGERWHVPDVTGNPVRPEISAIADAPYTAPHTTEKVRLFVMGGSLGARVFGRAVPEAVALLSQELRNRLSITQQARAEDLAQAEEDYRALGLTVELKPFFDDVPQRLRDAHMLITRAGASTLAELTAAGRPAVLVPLPNSIDDHQMANARALDSVGRAKRRAMPPGEYGELAGWQLEPRSIPPMEETTQRLARVRRATGVGTGDAFLRGAGDLVIPPRARVSLLLDQGHTTNAYTVIETSGGLVMMADLR